MRLDEPNSAMESLVISLKIAVAASFTAEPVLGTLAFWMKELGLARFTFGLRVRDEPTRPGGTGILPVRQRLEAGATQI